MAVCEVGESVQISAVRSVTRLTTTFIPARVESHPSSQTLSSFHCQSTGSVPAKWGNINYYVSDSFQNRQTFTVGLPLLCSKFQTLQLSLVFILYFVVQNVAIHDCWVELFILHHLLYQIYLSYKNIFVQIPVISTKFMNTRSCFLPFEMSKTKINAKHTTS